MVQSERYWNKRIAAMRGVDSSHTRGNTPVQVGTNMEDGGFLNQGDLKMNALRKLLTEELTLNNETWDDVVHHTPFEVEKIPLMAWTLWTHNRVYFPVVYDIYTWVKSVPRNPCNLVTQPVGGS